MAKNTIVYYTKEGNISSGVASSPFVGSAGTPTTFFTAGSEGSKIYKIFITATALDINQELVITIDNAIVFRGIPTVLDDMLIEIKAPVDCNSRPFLNIPANATIEFTVNNLPGYGSTVRTVSAYIYGEDY